MAKLCVFGSRSLKGEKIQTLIDLIYHQTKATEIVTAAEPHGVCEEAREYAKLNKIPLKAFEKDLARLAGMFHWRSVHAYEYADIVLIIHDGKSKGSKNEFDLAVKMGIPVIYYSLTEKNKDNQEVIEWDVETINW